METMTGISPVPPERRNPGGLDIGLIWFGAAIVITECWAGGRPAPTGLGLVLGLDVGVGSSLPCILVMALVHLALAGRPRAEGS
jgi:purine-cytosine permease-like protein